MERINGEAFVYLSLHLCCCVFQAEALTQHTDTSTAQTVGSDDDNNNSNGLRNRYIFHADKQLKSSKFYTTTVGVNGLLFQERTTFPFFALDVCGACFSKKRQSSAAL